MSVNFHFLNVGSGDCTIIYFPQRTSSDGSSKDERIMVIDMCHDSESEYTNIVDYYKKNFSNTDGTIKPIFRFVCTHPHQDHICGLNDFFSTKGISVTNFWDIEHEWEPDDFENHRTHEEDWKYYKKLRQGEVCKVLNYTSDTTASKYWDNGEDRITILNPSQDDIKKAHYTEDNEKRADIQIDEIAFALLIKINTRSVLLSGDGHSDPVWERIYERYSKEITNCSILKAGHHGQESSFHEKAVKLMNPEYIVFSNSADCDKKDGAESKYKKAVPNCKLYKTFQEGNIIIEVPFNKEEPLNIYSNN